MLPLRSRGSRHLLALASAVASLYALGCHSGPSPATDRHGGTPPLGRGASGGIGGTDAAAGKPGGGVTGSAGGSSAAGGAGGGQAAGGAANGGQTTLGSGGETGVPGSGGVGSGGFVGSGGVNGPRYACPSSWPAPEPPSDPATACPTVDAPPSDAAALRVYAMVSIQLHDDLGYLVGRYACGTAPLYRGTFSASDSGMDVPIKNAPVIASLETDPTDQHYTTCGSRWSGVRELSIGETEAPGTSIRFFQLPDAATTYVSLLRAPNSTWSGVSASCATCVPDLRGAMPATITISAARLDGMLCDDNPFSVTASGQLSRIATPSTDDVFAINQLIGDYRWPGARFTLVGNEQVATIDGFLVEPVSNAGCEATQNTHYHVDWYINVDDPKKHGLRNFRIEPTTLQCCPTIQV